MDIKLELVTQSPIIYNDIKIFQPKFEDIQEFGIEQFSKLLLPFSLTVDLLNIPEERQDTYDMFNDFIMKDEMIFNLLILAIRFFCQCNCIWLQKDGIKIRKGVLNSSNFKEFSDIILKICAKERLKADKPPKFKAEKGTPEYDEALERWKLLQEGRKRSAQKNEIHLCDVLNVCEFYDYYVPMETIRKWTLNKIMQCYQTKLGVSDYRDSFSIYLVSGEKSLVEDKHWTQQIKMS